MCVSLVIVLYDVALSVSWSVNENACSRRLGKEEVAGCKEVISPITLVTVFTKHSMRISITEYLLFILYIFRIYDTIINQIRSYFVSTGEL